jgi:hypothetical protein
MWVSWVTGTYWNLGDCTLDLQLRLKFVWNLWMKVVGIDWFLLVPLGGGVCVVISTKLAWFGFTGDSQIGPKVTPLDPSSVASVVVYGTSSGNYTHMAYGKSEVYSQTYPFEGVLNYTSGIIHHVHITGPFHLVLLLMFLLLSLV